MRIYGNRLLKTLPGQHTRPTTGKVRMALFNRWRDRISGSQGLDLCAGNGSIGAEALCRGAQGAIAIEQSGAACRLIRANWDKMAKDDQTWQVIQGSVVQSLPRLAGQTFDWIYFDPPYGSGLYDQVLPLIDSLALLDPAGEMAVEFGDRQWSPPETIGSLGLIDQRRYGLSHLAFYQWGAGL